jgi:hypothetical protein
MEELRSQSPCRHPRVGNRVARSVVGASIVAAALLVTGCLTCCVTGCAAAAKLSELVIRGDDRLLRHRKRDAPQYSPSGSPILFLAFDGIDRALLYDMLRKGELPVLGALLGGDHGRFPHAYFEESLLSTLPSSTMPAWTTAMTGVPPAQHGVTGNEFFIREERRLAAPAPVAFSDASPTIAVYTGGYLNGLCNAPTVYERMRVREPDILVWVAMHQIFAGADRLLLAKPTVLATAFEDFLTEQVIKAGQKNRATRSVYEKLDKDVVATLDTALKEGQVPDVLTLYLSGTDLYAHVADEGPDEARRAYLREVVEPALADLTEVLRRRDALRTRYVVLTSDHGHTAVLYDDAHALGTKNNDGPPTLLRRVGFRVRPFKLDVPSKEGFDAVLAYGGATAFVYAADRSTCPAQTGVCDWSKPPRFEEDVLPIAEAFYENNEDGSVVPGMKGTLDMVLTRRPRAYAEEDLPFEVYVGHGKMIPVDQYLAEHPHPSYVEVQSRLRELAVGPHGERAGDVMLLAHDGDRDTPEGRYYFASRYRSWHGSPSRQDSEIPLVVANPALTSEALRARVEQIIGHEPHQQAIAELLLGLRRLNPE